MDRNLFPKRKISETLIDYARPFVACIDLTTTEEQIRQGFTVAVTVWNCFVFDGAQGGNKYMALLKQHMGDAWEKNPLVRTLVERRKRHFADDMRAIGNFRVHFDGGELKVWAEARDPYSSSPKSKPT
jgi:hypothetical protein